MNLPIILIEGEKKAYVLCSKGIPAIGLTGINGFYRYSPSDEKYHIAPGYKDIPGLIEKLHNHKPGLVLLHDGDALAGSRQRKNGFYSSIKAFKTLFTGVPLSYAMVNPSLDAKGIDDAYLAYPDAEFKDLVNAYPLNTFEQLTEIRKLFVPSVGAKNWDTLNNVLSELGLSFRWNTRKFLLQCSKNGEPFHTVGNIDSDICREMQLSDVNIGTVKLNEMLRSSHIAEPYDSITSFFDSLPKWDGTDYLEQLCKFIQLHSDEDPIYFHSMLKKHLIRTVRCAIESNNVNRVVLVLHGGQGIGKSEFWRWLTPNDLFYEEAIDPQNKDSEFPLAQYLMVNLDELDTLAKRDVAHLKSFISKASVKQRPAYGKNIEEFARIASFVGSTNRSDILSDEANTRWLILKVENFDWKGYTASIDPLNIWSQVYAMYQADHAAGEMSEIEKSNQACRNGDFLENSVERELLNKHFEIGEDPYTLSMILSYLIQNSTIKCLPGSLAKELKRLYGEPVMSRNNGVPGRYYSLKIRQQPPEQSVF
jgi:hypothetical protein